MASFIIFWSVLLAILFFALSAVTKAILAVLMGCVDTFVDLFKVLFFVGGTAFALFLLAQIVEAIQNGSIWNAIGTIVVFVIVMGIFISLVGGVFVVVLEIAAAIAAWVAMIVINAFTAVYSFFESGYAFFLRTIMKRIGMAVEDDNTVTD